MTGESFNKVEHLEKQLQDYPIALDPEQVAKVLGVTRRYVDGLIDDGILDGFVLDPSKQYKQRRVLKATLIAYMIQNNI